MVVVVVVDEEPDEAAFLSSETATATTANAATATAIPATPKPARPAAADAAALPAAAPALAPALPPAAEPELAEPLDCAHAACALNNIKAHKIDKNFFIFKPRGVFIKLNKIHITYFFYVNINL